VFIGFGSMSGADPDATTATMLAAARKAGVRAVIGTAWGGLTAETASDVFTIGEVPFDQLFPQVAAVIHHGGTGRPQVICPFVADQPFWGHRMHQLGVATEPVHQRHLDPDRLAAAITQAVTDTRLTTTAHRLGHLIRTEDGVHEAVHQLETIAAQPPARPLWT